MPRTLERAAGIDLEELHAAASCLLEAHIEASRKPVHERTPIEAHVAVMGRNRLQTIASLTSEMIEKKG